MCDNITITSEYVSYGHPDKIADQISDAILDEFLRQDPSARTGIETMVKDNIVVLGGEVNSTAVVDYDAVVRKVYSTLPFPENHNLSPDKIKVINLIGKQSPEIHAGVDKSETVLGAGDQGFVVGYASTSTPDYLPIGYYLAKKICQAVCQLEGMGPDTKAQVVMEHGDDTNKFPVVKSILVSTMHTCPLYKVKRTVSRLIRKNVGGFIPDHIFSTYIKGQDIQIDVNPCGSWQIGGPVSDCGVTGRKIVVDQYGGYANVGGGAFSGKDYTKVDRSAAYMARYLARNIVEAGLSNDAKVELAYMIGVPDPVAINIQLDCNCHYIDKIKEFFVGHVDMTPWGIKTKFNLTDVNYFNLARQGHFGDHSLPWEKADLCQALYEYCNN